MGPVEAATADLVTWLERVAGQPVRVGPPVDAPDEAVTLWPYALRPLRQTTGTGPRHPYRFTVRYVVTGGALAILDRVLSEAMLSGEPAVSLSELDGSVWLAIRAAPRPVLVVDVPAAVTYPAPEAPLVRGPLSLKQAGLRPLVGSVLGPGDEPVVAVRVAVAGTGPAAYTDTHGQFRLGGVPDGDRVGLHIEGRGRSFTAEVDLTATGPLLIHCPFT